MNQHLFGCSAMNGPESSKVDLCPALHRLMEEHILLREAMDEFYETAKQVETSDDDTRIRNLFVELTGQVSAFVNELEPHARREDNGLFPMMAQYIGREMGPIAVMEYEHEQAEQCLQLVLEAANRLEAEFVINKAKDTAIVAIQAYTILSEHFCKEEHVLFPMAEKMLSQEEKDELARKFEEW